jgi:hypothetical protein
LQPHSCLFAERMPHSDCLDFVELLYAVGGK